MSNKLAKMSSLQRDNLLINSDFRSGIINQKGNLIYDGINGSKKYVIDMWYVLGNSTVTVKSNSILVKNNQTTSSLSFSQYHNLKKGIYTLTVNVLSITGKVTTMTTASIPNSGMELKKGLNIVKIDLDKYVLADSFGAEAVYFDIAVGANIEFEYIKLECGDCYTGMPAWNCSLELLKCQRYFQIYEGAFVGSLTSGTYFFGQQLRVMMKKDPLVKVRRLNSGNGTDISSKVKSMVCYKNLFDYIVLSSPHNEIQIRGSFELDAYDY